jgi:hypothetical protein
LSLTNGSLAMKKLLSVGVCAGMLPPSFQAFS